MTHGGDPNRYYHSVRVVLGVMGIKRYARLPRSPEQEPHHLMQFSAILWTPLGRGIPLLKVQLPYSKRLTIVSIQRYFVFVNCCNQENLLREFVFVQKFYFFMERSQPANCCMTAIVQMLQTLESKRS